MICPRCNSKLVEVSKEGVLVDICAHCRGVWLDRGELDKLLSSSKQFYNEYHDVFKVHYKKHHKKPLWLQILDELLD
ncbi:MAG: zf-TFIIB domain-containing protein [Bacillota bacterium]